MKQLFDVASQLLIQFLFGTNKNGTYLLSIFFLSRFYKMCQDCSTSFSIIVTVISNCSHKNQKKNNNTETTFSFSRGERWEIKEKRNTRVDFHASNATKLP